MSSRDLAQAHWENTNYRGPYHPVVSAFAEIKLQIFERLLEQAQLKRPAVEMSDLRVLDVGAGPGIFTVPLARRFDNVTAVDLFRIMIGRNPAPRRLQADAYTLPFRAGSFDLIFLGNVLHHLDSPVECLREIRRVLRPKGALLSLEPNCLHPLMFLFGLAVKEERRLIRFTPGHMRRLAETAGFELHGRVISGQIFQNTTQAWMLPLVQPFERANYPLGGYQHTLLRPRLGG